jgi:hypothetical protein
MKKIDKEYPHPFLLEPTKLNRIVDTIHASFAAIPNATLHANFEVFLTGDRREELPSVDAVLALDNTRKHKIQRLVIFSSASSPGSPKPDQEVQVDFAGPQLARTILPKQTAIPDISPHHLNAPVPRLVHDRPLRGPSNRGGGGVSGPNPKKPGASPLKRIGARLSLDLLTVS